MEKSNREIEEANKKANKIVEDINEKAQKRLQEQHEKAEKVIEEKENLEKAAKSTKTTNMTSDSRLQTIKTDLDALQSKVDGLVRSQKEESQKTETALKEV